MSILCLHKDLHATMEVPPEPSSQRGWFMLETVGSRVARSAGVGRAAPARVLSGPLRLPRQESCQGNLLLPSALCGLGLGVALVILGFGLTLAHLPCSAWCDRGRGSDCPCTGKGVQKCAPPFVHRHTAHVLPYLSQPHPHGYKVELIYVRKGSPRGNLTRVLVVHLMEDRLPRVNKQIAT